MDFVDAEKPVGKERERPSHQVGSDTEMFTNGVLLLSRKGSVHALILPLTINFPHGIFRNFGKDHLGGIMLLRG